MNASVFIPARFDRTVGASAEAIINKTATPINLSMLTAMFYICTSRIYVILKVVILKLLSIKTQQLLLLLYDSNDLISFKTQPYFKNQRSFKIAVRDLEKAGIIKRIFSTRDCYQLSKDGVILVELIKKLSD